MKNGAALVEWSILDDEQEWEEQELQESLPTADAGLAVAQRSGVRSELYLCMLALLPFLVMLGGRLWTWQNREATPPEGNLATAEDLPQYIANPRYSLPFAEELQQRSDTPHFSWTFYAVDAEVVQEVAPRLEKLYAKLCDEFGVAEGECFYYYKIDVLPDKILPDNRPALSHFNSAQATITIVSPARPVVPDDGSAADDLYLALIYPVASMHLLNIVESRQVPVARNEEEIEESQQMLSPQSDERVNWPTVMLALRLWVFYEEKGQTALANEHLARWLNQGDEIAPAPVVDGSLAGAFDSVTGLATLLDYGVATYGREGLPALLARFGQPTGREEMIELLFNLSYAEFEAAWQSRLPQS